MARQPGLIGRVEDAAAELAALLLATPRRRRLRSHDWAASARAGGTLRREVAWTNTLVATSALRRAHVEFFAIPGELGVLHVCIFPRLDRALPIFGFDVIVGREKATGCFLDLSPTVPAAEAIAARWSGDLAGASADLGGRRVLPDWASVFSATAIAVRPHGPAQVDAALQLGAASLRWYLAAACTGAARIDAGEVDAMRTAQVRYVEAQRSNDRTRRVLEGCVGEQLAGAFIRRCLFPTPAAARRTGTRAGWTPRPAPAGVVAAAAAG